MADTSPNAITVAKREQPFWRTAWPDILPGDSESLRRRKLAVRAGHLAMVFMVFVAMSGAWLANPAKLTTLQSVGLAVAGVVYVLWNIVGTRGIVTLVLWEGVEAPSLSLRQPRCGALVFFIIQTGLAGVVYFWSDRGNYPSQTWLGLLPPIAYAVFIVEWRGIVTVSFLMLLVFVSSILRWHDWPFAANAGLAFSFAILFTVVFSILAVQSEKARNQVHRLATELSEANRQLREHAVQAEELSATRERNRIAREIHDSLGHFLTVANMQLEAARALWPTDPVRARDAVGKAQTFIQEGLQDIRRSVSALRNSPLDNKSLAQALHELVGAPGAEKPGTELAILGMPRSLPPPAELSLYRAAQEGLTNAHRHSRAGHVRVVLDYRAIHAVTLQVSDDGVGAADLAGTDGFGLRGLRERAQLLGGTVEIETAPGAGFSLKFQAPA